ncbi:MAG: polysaccharide deacetylase family protein [Deltaproteobacteria bacterium]|nr:polysaccharide deacetylase family protein [Deltaproteobacteria bacterium]
MSGAAIFAYHNFVERPDAPAPAAQAYVLSQAQFDAHLAALEAPGLRPSRLADVLATPSSGRFVLSFDDGYLTDYTVAFVRLAERAWPGCFFVVAGQVGAPRALGWRELREMAAAGMEIGCHSLTHPFLHRADPDEIRREFGEAKRILEDGLGQAVHFASLPRGSAAPGMGALIKELGYRAFCTSDPGLVSVRTDPYEVPRIAVKQRTTPEFLRQVCAGRRLTLATLQSFHAVKKLGKQLVGAERWRHIRGVLMDVAERARA